jgi:hypothetical protein
VYSNSGGRLNSFLAIGYLGVSGALFRAFFVSRKSSIGCE